MTEHILPESTNACPTSPTTDNQPELLPVIQADRDAAADYWLGEGYTVLDHAYRTGAMDQKACVQSYARHRLTSTTPTLGDMVMVPREVVAKMARDAATIARLEGIAADDEEMGAKVGRILDAFAGDIAALSAAPASPIPISVNEAGVREALAYRYVRPNTLHPSKPDHVVVAPTHERWRNADGWTETPLYAALSPALDNTAVEENRRAIETAPRNGTHILGWHSDNMPPVVVHYWDAAGEEGFYLSLGASGEWDRPIALIGWMPLPEPPFYNSDWAGDWQHDTPSSRPTAALTPGTLDNTAVEGQLRTALQEAHDTLHECTAVLHADDCRKVAAVMERCRAALTAETENA